MVCYHGCSCTTTYVNPQNTNNQMWCLTLCDPDLLLLPCLDSRVKMWVSSSSKCDALCVCVQTWSTVNHGTSRSHKPWVRACGGGGRAENMSHFKYNHQPLNPVCHNTQYTHSLLRHDSTRTTVNVCKHIKVLENELLGFLNITKAAGFGFKRNVGFYLPQNKWILIKLRPKKKVKLTINYTCRIYFNICQQTSCCPRC